MGYDGENGEAVADLLKDSKINARSEQGVIIRGEVLDSELVGPMNGKSLHHLINAMTDGQTYVSFNTPTHLKGEIRGQVEVSEGSLGG